MENTIIICNKEEYLPRVEKFLNENGVTWFNSVGGKFTVQNSRWESYKKDSIYFIRENLLTFGNAKCSYDWSRYGGYIRINAKDLPDVNGTSNEPQQKEKLDLTEILQGCEGIKLYSSIFGVVTFVQFYENSLIVKARHNARYQYYTNGVWMVGGECTLFPSKDQRDWSNFVKPIPSGTPMVCSDNLTQWLIGYSCNTIEGVAIVDGGRKEMSKDIGCTIWKYMIPFDKFNPNDIEESLKHNIQK